MTARGLSSAAGYIALMTAPRLYFRVGRVVGIDTVDHTEIMISPQIYMRMAYRYGIKTAIYIADRAAIMI